MKKILGLDIGVASIGWAFIELDEENKNNRILGIGSRIIPLSSDENDEFTRGNEQTTNANRRIKRGMRRNLQRYKLRKSDLTKALSAAGMYPDPDLFKLDTLNLYKLRARAPEEQISLKELGRLLYMLNQKRGYKSNRKANNEEESAAGKEKKVKPLANSEEEVPARQKKKGYLELIADREALLIDKKITIGRFLYEQLSLDRHYKVKDNIFLRSSYIAEFDLIWTRQKEFYPEILNDDLYDRIRNNIIYYQRRLKSQKALVSDCRFEQHHKCIPKSSPLFQVFKLWQDINNIEILSFKGYKGQETDPRFEGKRSRKLSLEEKQILFKKANESEKISKKDALKLLGYEAKYDHYSWNLKKELDGNRTLTALKQICDKFLPERPEILNFDLKTIKGTTSIVDTETGEILQSLTIDPDFEFQPLFQLWHLLYSIDEPGVLIKALVDKYGMLEEHAKAFAGLDFHKAGYGALSARAIRKILPYQMMGMIYDKACVNAGYNHSDSLTTEQNNERLLAEKLDILKKGSLRNPVVEKILNHTINLVNAIIEDTEFGRPDEIRVELARELTQNAEQREKSFKRNTDTSKKHADVEKRLREELGFTRVSRNDIEKYKLWEEVGGLSLYEPSSDGKLAAPIKLSDLYNGTVDVDHIIPRSRIFDDSFQNKVLCPRIINEIKGQMTAHDYMKSINEETFHSYVELVTQNYKAGKITKAKFNRLTMSAKEIPEDFINRQLNETQYIAREVKSILSGICRNVYSTSGSVTDYQRYHWGYESITQKLNWERYSGTGLTSIEQVEDGSRIYRIEGWSKRDDHRHHAIDALVIAATRQSTIQRLNNLNQIVEAKADLNTRDALIASDLLGVKEYVMSRCPFTECEVEEAVANILVSFKSGKRVAILNKNTYKHKSGSKPVQNTLTPRGYLHKETVYGKIKEPVKVILNTRFDQWDKIVSPSAQSYLKNHLAGFGDESKKAFTSKELEKMAFYLKENPVPGISVSENKVEVSCFKESFVLHYPLSSLAPKDVAFVVDPVVKKVLQARITLKGEKDAFKNLENDPVWFDQERGIQIKKVRLYTGLEGLVSLHKSLDGKTFPGSESLETAKSVDFVSTRNNHHIALYKDVDGKIVENVVTFWDALNRKRLGIPVVVKNPDSVWSFVINNGIEDQNILENLPGQDWQFLTSLQQNEMFIYGLSKEEIETLYLNKEYKTISQHLFRVQKIGQKDYFFRYHLETKVDDSSLQGQHVGKFKRITSLSDFKFIKIRINNLGKITLIGDT